MTTLTDESSPLLEVRSVQRSLAGSLTDSEERSEPNYRVLAAWWVGIATVARLVSVARLPLGNGEAYYYSWSKFLDWSYYDHPPLVAWMARATTMLGASPVSVRLGPILAAGAFGLLLFRLAERLYRPRAAFLALVLVTALPVFLGSSFVLNPEAPLAPLWVGFLLVLEGMRRRDEAYRPLLAGALLGFAFLAKYTGVLLVPAALIYVASSAPTRRWLKRPSFYAGGAVALLIALPVLVWNQARGWPSLHLHFVERATAVVPVAGENRINELVSVSAGAGLGQVLLRVAMGQLIAYSPLLAPLLGMALVRSLRRSRLDDRDLFLTAFSWPVLLPLLAAMTRFKDAEQHWTMVAVVPAVMGAAHYADVTWSHGKDRWSRLMAFGGVALSAAAFLLGNVHARSTALLRLIPAEHYDPRADIINELVGWDQVRASVRQAASAVPGRVVLASSHYSLCGRMLFEMGDWPPVYCPTARRTAFDYFDRRDPPTNATVIALTDDIHDEVPAGLQDRACKIVDQVDVERGGRRVARYFIQSCAPAPDPEDRASRE